MPTKKRTTKNIRYKIADILPDVGLQQKKLYQKRWNRHAIVETAMDGGSYGEQQKITITKIE